MCVCVVCRGVSSEVLEVSEVSEESDRRCRTLTRLTPIGMSHAYKLSELVLRVSECVEAVSVWCRSVSIDTSVGRVDSVQKCPSVNQVSIDTSVKVSSRGVKCTRTAAAISSMMGLGRERLSLLVSPWGLCLCVCTCVSRPSHLCVCRVGILRWHPSGALTLVRS